MITKLFIFLKPPLLNDYCNSQVGTYCTVPRLTEKYSHHGKRSVQLSKTFDLSFPRDVHGRVTPPRMKRAFQLRRVGINTGLSEEMRNVNDFPSTLP